MNPFKQKQLDEFTIADCESYICQYPYGEHLSEVKTLLRKLKKQKEAQQKTISEKNKKVDPHQKNKSTTKKTDSNQQKPKIQKDTTSSGDVIKTVFSLIGTIVAVLVVGTIIIIVLNEILPYNWWNKYRYLIYPVVWTIGHWLQDKFD